MSMISEQIQALRDLSAVYIGNGLPKVFAEAADTIEELSAKLATANIERSTAYYNDGWIPCSSGRLPENGRTVPITTEYISGCRHITSASYHTKKGIVDDYEWTGEGFYQYDSEYGYGRLDGVVAWLDVEPYKGVE